MKVNTGQLVIIVALFVAGGIVGYIIAPKPDPHRSERLERRAFYDSILLKKQQDQIISHISILDSLKEENYLLMNKEAEILIRWDTVQIKVLAEAEKDSVVKQALNDCVTNDRIKSNQITRLRKISVSQDEIISNLKAHIKELNKYLSTKEDIIIEYRTTNTYLASKNKALRVQRNFAFAGVGILVLIGLLLK